MKTEIYVKDQTGSYAAQKYSRAVRAAVKCAMKSFANDEGYEVSVLFANAYEIRELNRNYRGVDEVTDVLSFPLMDEDPEGVQLLGDIVICLARAQEQAEEFGHSVKREVSYLSVHSILHLLGYDHETEGDKLLMRTEEKRIMDELGIYREDGKPETGE